MRGSTTPLSNSPSTQVALDLEQLKHGRSGIFPTDNTISPIRLRLHELYYLTSINWIGMTTCLRYLEQHGRSFQMSFIRLAMLVIWILVMANRFLYMRCSWTSRPRYLVRHVSSLEK